MAAIHLQNLHKRFGDFVAVKDSTLSLPDGQFVVLLGPSGCGKTTTLRMIAGLEYPSAGQIYLDDQDVTYRRPRERDIAMVFQLFALYPHMGVRENLAFPLRNERLPKAEIARRIAEVAAILRIEHLLGSRVGGLSGGDRQRVALGRAIVRQPQAYLMDEPLGTLDAEFRELMCVELRKLHERLHTTTVFVTHDQNEAMALADHIVVMDQGEVLQSAAPEAIYNFPSCMFVAGFIGRPPMNFIPLTAAVRVGHAAVEAGEFGIAVPQVAEASDQAMLGVRPEHVDLTNDGPLPATVTNVEYFGSHWIAHLDSPVGALRASVPKQTQPSVGEQLRLCLRTERLVLFDRASTRLLASATTLAADPGARHG
jgi:multiple sugar transport system ATP-binding protein